MLAISTQSVYCEKPKLYGGATCVGTPVNSPVWVLPLVVAARVQEASWECILQVQLFQVLGAPSLSCVSLVSRGPRCCGAETNPASWPCLMSWPTESANLIKWLYCVTKLWSSLLQSKSSCNIQLVYSNWNIGMYVLSVIRSLGVGVCWH